MSKRNRVVIPGAKTTDEYADGASQVLALFYGLTSAGVGRGKARDFQLIHGLVAHCNNVAGAALYLLSSVEVDYSMAAAPLVRVALEHALTVQWLVLHPGGPEEFVKHASFKNAKFHELTRQSALKMPDEVRDYYDRTKRPRASKQLSQVRKMVDSLDPEGWLYLIYSDLSAYVHPSAAEVVRYLDTRQKPPGTLLRTEFSRRPLMHALAMSTCLANAVYLDLIRGKPHKAALTKIADSVGMPLWLTPDGKPPRHPAAL